MTHLIVLFLLGIISPAISLIETKSIKIHEVRGYKEVVMQTGREDVRDESKGHPNNEHTASHQHDLVQTGL